MGLKLWSPHSAPSDRGKTPSIGIGLRFFHSLDFYWDVMIDLPNVAWLWPSEDRHFEEAAGRTEKPFVVGFGRGFLMQTLLCLSSLLAAQDQLYTTNYTCTTAELQAIVPGSYSKQQE